MGRVSCLDGLRGLAVAFVVVSHLSQLRVPLFPGLDLAGSGFYGVCLFFTLSAYLLTSLLLKNSPDALHSAEVWTQYFKRRFFRIYPLYSVVLLATCLASFLGADFVDRLTFDSVVDHLMLRAGVGVFWTIPIECYFYALLPLIVLAGAALPHRPAILVAAAALLIGLVSGIKSFFPSTFPAELWRTLPAFLGGVFAAWAHDSIETMLGPLSSRARTAVEGAGWLAMAIVLLHIPSVWSWVTGEEVLHNRFFAEPGRFGALWTVCLIAAMHGEGTMRRVLSLAPLRFLGAISFGVYLLHFPIVKLGSRHLTSSPTLAGWLAVAATLTLAAATYFAIEKPFMKLGRTPASKRKVEA
ncbi:MAG TPA: acyltransferase [Candidatus Limnocylindrales bacterium]|nr:acyltransferase [Candidatus Limnocylindrales bacterium]